GLPQALIDLMKSNEITVEMIKQAVLAKGFFPASMEVREYDADFLEYLTTSDGWGGLMNEIQLPF
ncbi:hypothetical protein LI276_23485, partial [[Clostridium] scindens]|nr:hypothetical protein [[Clostridium] scindens]